MPDQTETSLNLLLKSVGLLNWQYVHPELLEVILLPQEGNLPEKKSNIKESRAGDGY